MSRPCINSTLNSAINGTCFNQIVGVEEKSALIAQSLIDKATLAFDADSVICNVLELTGNATSVTVCGDFPYKDTKIDGKAGTYVSLFESTVVFPIQENSPASAKQVMQLGNGRYVQVVQFKGYDPLKKNKYGIIGLNRGLKFDTSNLDFSSQDAYGYKITLKESDGLVPIYFYWPATGGEAAADAWFAGLFV